MGLYPTVPSKNITIDIWLCWINDVIVIGWLSYEKNFMAPQVILTCKMPSDTPNNITGHTDLLLSGESSTNKI